MLQVWTDLYSEVKKSSECFPLHGMIPWNDSSLPLLFKESYPCGPKFLGGATLQIDWSCKNESFVCLKCCVLLKLLSQICLRGINEFLGSSRIGLHAPRRGRHWTSEGPQSGHVASCLILTMLNLVTVLIRGIPGLQTSSTYVSPQMGPWLNLQGTVGRRLRASTLGGVAGSCSRRTSQKLRTDLGSWPFLFRQKLDLFRSDSS